MTRDGKRGFTIIELLMVIAIMMVIAAMALPYFVAMQKSRKWTTAVTNIQSMVWRARALATNVRRDFAVEFNCQGDCGTQMVVVAKSNLLQRLPDLNWLEHNLGDGGNIAWIIWGEWEYAGGPINWDGKYYQNLSPGDIHPNPTNSTFIGNYGHNSYQSEVLAVHPDLTIDPSTTASPNFINWDQNCYYGADTTPDIRIGPNGALVQTQDPTLCIKQIRGTEMIRVEVIRCTGRLKQLQR